MKKFNLLVIALCSILFTSAQTVATFENLTLTPNSYWNGSDLSADGFSSGKGYFVNNYDTAWGGSWSGFAYSNTTDVTTAGFMNQYSAITGSGFAGSANYAVASGYGSLKIKLEGIAAGGYVKGFYITNSTYAYLSMKDGDQFAKKFGGATGNDADWFKVTVGAWKDGAVKTEQVDFMLADFTFADNTQDYILNSWAWLNLQPLGNVDSLFFNFTSSDTGQFGINTPTYFVMDDFTTANTQNVAPVISGTSTFSTDYNTPITINVLNNVFDTTATPLTVTTTGAGIIAGSSVVVTQGSELEYTPAVGIVAVDTVTYAVCDDAGLCATSRVVITVTGITGIDDINANAVNVYPNPFGNQLRIAATTAISELALFDLNGRQMNAVVSFNGNTATINTTEVAAGIYVVKAVSASGTSFTKVTK